MLCNRQRSGGGGGGLGLALALLWCAVMPFRIGEMRPAEPQPAFFTVALALFTTGFVHARNTLAHLFFCFDACRAHRVLQITEEHSSVRGMSVGGFHDPHFIGATARNIHPPVGSRSHISHRRAAGGRRQPSKAS